MELVTVRIPELPPQGSLTLDDKIPVWIAADNKTRNASLTDLRTLIITGGGASYAPVYLGGSVIYQVPADAAGGTIASIPTLAGKDFLLRREGRPLIPGTEYEILFAGGFKLKLPGDVLFENERFELDVFSLQGGAPAPIPSSGGGSFITGIVPVTTNLTMNVTDHIGKLLQVRAASNIITITLPDIGDEDLPDNTIIPIETMINNSFQCRITTQAGQYIYMRNTGVTNLYMGIGESLWLFKGADGWYVINDFAQVYERVGKIEASYKISINEVLADGSLLSRTAYPRLFEYALTLGSSIVSEATWQTATGTVAGRTVTNPYRGCFSLGDGSTTFRVPNLMNVALRGIKSMSGSDTERLLNKAGGFQRHEFESHDHGFRRGESFTGSGGVGTGITGRGSNNQEDVQVSSTGGAETRMDNVGILWTIKC